MTTLTVLGIDPGLTRLGYGVVEEAGGNLNGVAAGTIRSSAEDGTARRLAHLDAEITGIIERYKPDVVAVERVFFKLNARTAIPSIQAWGVVLASSARSGIDVFEFSPLEVKMSVVGTGTADKIQVEFMIKRLLGSTKADSADAFDALAVAVTYLNSRRIRMLEKAR